MLPPAVRAALDNVEAFPCTCGAEQDGRELADHLRRMLPGVADSDIGAVLAVTGRDAWNRAQARHSTAGDRALERLAHVLTEAACELTRMERQEPAL